MLLRVGVRAFLYSLMKRNFVVHFYSLEVSILQSSNSTSKIYPPSMHTKSVDKDTVVLLLAEKYLLYMIIAKQLFKYTTVFKYSVLIQNNAFNDYLLNNSKFR